jgi:hypothetical protein
MATLAAVSHSVPEVRKVALFGKEEENDSIADGEKV